MIMAVALLVALYVSRPILASQSTSSPATFPAPAQDDHSRSNLLAEYDQQLNILQELDFDQALGKIPEGDYPQQRQALLQSAADILRRLDALDGASEAHPEGGTPAADFLRPLGAADAATEVQTEGGTNAAEDRIEAAIAARRAVLKPQEIAARPSDELEAMITARRRARQEKSGGFCPHCGKPVRTSDRFCPKCGKALSA